MENPGDVITARQVGCSLCPELCASRSQIVDGCGSEMPALMVVAEAPGEWEDKQGTPFVGESGKLIRATISEAGVHQDRVYFTNVLKCRPPENRDPKPEEMFSCQAWLIDEIDRLRPTVILCLGKFAREQVSLLLSANAWPNYRPLVVAVVHPAASLRSPSQRESWKDSVKTALASISNRPHDLDVIPVPEPWEEGELLISGGRVSPWLSVDTETDDLTEDWGNKMVCFQISDGVTVNLIMAGPQIPLGQIVKHVYAHNIKYDAPHLGIDLEDLSKWDDTGLMAYVLRYPRVGLKEIGPALTGIPMEPISSILKYRKTETKSLKTKCPECKGRGTISIPIEGPSVYGDDTAICLACSSTGFKQKITEKWATRPFFQALRDEPEKARLYAMKDPVVTARVAQILDTELYRPENRKLLRYYHEIEKPCTPVILKMEQAGVLIDQTALGPLEVELTAEIGKWNARIVDILHDNKRDFTGAVQWSPSSNQQLAERMIRAGYRLRNKTATGQWQVDKQTFLQLEGVDSVDELDEDSLAFAVLEMRRNAKLLSTYVKVLRNDVDSEGRLHCSFNQMVAGTNRLSSSNPNLQNIPIRGKIGKTLRRVFIPKPGYVISKVDASQLEVRIFAHYTQDPILLAAYPISGSAKDVHQGVADALGIERWRAKNTLFCAVYGGAAAKLAATAGVDAGAAGPFLERLKTEMPSLVSWQKYIAAQLTRQGYIETLLGWRNYYPLFWSPIRSEARAALREAANCPIQGTASGLVKLLMIRAAEIARRYGATIMLQVHDELVSECPLETVRQFSEELAEAFVEIGREVGLTVPLVLNCEVGLNWGDTVPVEDWVG